MPWLSRFRSASCLRDEIETVDLSWLPHPAQRVVAERLETAAVADHRNPVSPLRPQMPKSSLSVRAVEAIDCALARSSALFFGSEKPCAVPL